MKKVHKINGELVKDANKPITLMILDKDIQSGNSKDPTSCAADKACIRQLKVTNAIVHLSRTYIRIKKNWVRFETPRSLRSEIIAFDRGGLFLPGSHVLRTVRHSTRLGTKRKKYGAPKTKHPRKGNRLKITKVGGVRGHAPFVTSV